jgi:hypothetical protein
MGRLRLALRSRIEGDIAEAARSFSPDDVVSRFLGGGLSKNQPVDAPPWGGWRSR